VKPVSTKHPPAAPQKAATAAPSKPAAAKTSAKPPAKTAKRPAPSKDSPVAKSGAAAGS